MYGNMCDVPEPGVRKNSESNFVANPVAKLQSQDPQKTKSLVGNRRTLKEEREQEASRP